ncbi:MAG: hypothetical protein N3J91_11460 [Verrucomicrobiae bacterium]|nr:hypothetical protein [Verrucomicrobiae bacterium]
MKALLMIAALPGNREVVSQLLAERGLPCLTAANAREAEMQLHAQQGVACVVVDATGFTAELLQVCQRIVEQHIPLYWILPSAPQPGALAPPPGAAGVWHKPLALQPFLAAVRGCLESS